MPKRREEPLPLSGEAIVCLSSIDWDFIWQQNQEIMSRFAKAGHPVLFVENTGVRPPELADLPRLLARLRNWWRSDQGYRELAPNLVVLSPLLFPFPYSRWARWVNSALVGRAVERWLKAVERRAPVLWTFLPTPLVLDLAADMAPAALVYYCTADFASSSPGAAPAARSEEEVFRRADVVFTTSPALKRRAERFRRSVVPIDIAIDYEAFEAAREGRDPEPSEMAVIPRPRVGYVGGLHRWMDLELVAEMARRRPVIRFVLVGPEQTSMAALEDLPNVRLLGRREYRELPGYIKAFDVGIVPYREAEYTESVFPTKLNEYLAMGIPAVSTPLPSVVDYNARFGGVVGVASGIEDFLAALDSALAAPIAGRQARIEAARRNGWAARITEIESTVSRAVEVERSRPRVATGVLRRIPRPAALRAAALAVVVVILLGSPLPWLAAALLVISDAPTPGDAVVVVGGGAGEAGLVGRGEGERVIAGVELYKAGFARELVLCSGERSAYRELDVMRAIALAHGVPPTSIHLRERGGSSYAMLLDASDFLRLRGWRSVLLVSSPYHMRRAVGVWRRLNPAGTVRAVPASSSRLRRRHRLLGPSPSQLTALCTEALAYAYYLWKGWA